MSIHDGHRERLRAKVKELGLERLQLHEQLEYILFFVIPRGDTNETAHRLLDRFVTLEGVLNAEPEELCKVEGVGPKAAQFLTALPSIFGIFARNEGKNKAPKLESLGDVIEYAKTYFYGRSTEAAYIFCLNSSYKLLEVIKFSDGVKGETFMFPTQVAKKALLSDASMVLVVHNHPDGNLKPSGSDVRLSRRIMAALSSLEITLLDSIVVSGNEHFSMREKGYIEPLNQEYK